MKKKGIIPLFLQIVINSTIVWVLLLAATLGVTLQVSVSTLMEKNDKTLIAVGTSLSQSKMVIDAIEKGECSPALTEYLDNFLSTSPTMDVLTIANANSIRLYHVVHSRIGEVFLGGDQGDCLKGDSYFSNAVGTLGMQRRYFSPVRNNTGKVIGFVMTSTTMQQKNELRNEILRIYLGLSLILTAITLVVSSVIAIFIKRVMHGFSPEDLVHSYLKQNDVLNNLTEGVVLVDKFGYIQLTNLAAEKMIGQPGEVLNGRSLNVYLQDNKGKSLLTNSKTNTPTNRSNILATCIPLKKDSIPYGATLILTDRSEALRNAEQLTGTRHIISALRANSHEFMNKLQVLSGLLQMNKTKEAQEYIDDLSAIHSQSLTPFLQYIANTNVCALLLGKLNNARELDIEIKLLPNSHLPHHSQFLTTTELITIIGNLLENAMEAINAQISNNPRNITLQITEDKNGLLIIISDTGIGMSEDIIEHIYEEGFSTKGQEDRGIGMNLIRKIVDRNQGTIEIDSDLGFGTTFTLIFHNKIREGNNDTHNNN